MTRPRDRQRPVQVDDDLKLDKRLMILRICQMLGIPTTYQDKKKQDVDITEENYTSYVNLDFLLTSKPALKVLYTLAAERSNADDH